MLLTRTITENTMDDEDVRLTEKFEASVQKDPTAFKLIKKYLLCFDDSDDESEEIKKDIRQFFKMNYDIECDWRTRNDILRDALRVILDQDGALQLAPREYGCSAISAEEAAGSVNPVLVILMRELSKIMFIDTRKIIQAMGTCSSLHRTLKDDLIDLKEFNGYSEFSIHDIFFAESFVFSKQANVFDDDTDCHLSFAASNDDRDILVYLGTKTEHQILKLTRQEFVSTLAFLTATAVRTDDQGVIFANNTMLFAHLGISLTIDDVEVSSTDLAEQNDNVKSISDKIEGEEVTQSLISIAAPGIFERWAFDDVRYDMTNNNCSMLDLPVNIFGDKFFDVTNSIRSSKGKNIAAFTAIGLLMSVGGVLLFRNPKVGTAVMPLLSKIMKIKPLVIFTSWFKNACQATGHLIVQAKTRLANLNFLKLGGTVTKLKTVVSQSKFTQWMIKKALPFIGVTAAFTVAEGALDAISRADVNSQNASSYKWKAPSVSPEMRWKYDRRDIKELAIALLDVFGFTLTSADIVDIVEEIYA